jgi:predicted PurR-regulated permease PerM
VTSEEPENRQDERYLSRVVEVCIHIGLLMLLAGACLLVLLPFVPLIAWGIVIAVAGYPGYRRLQGLVGGRSGVAAVLFTLLLLTVLIMPVVLLTGTLVEGVQTLAAHLKDGTLIVPPPPPTVETWPLVGVPLKNMWIAASTNLMGLLTGFAPQIKAFIPKLLSASAGVGLGVLQFVLSILVAGALLSKARGCADLARSLFRRLFANKGPEYQVLVEATIRSVANGILGVALIQAVFAGIGFLAVGMPGAGLWALMFLFAAVLQAGILVMIPAVIYVFTIASTTKAIIFLIWCLVVGLMDNVLKPLLLGRGVSVPIVVIFVGAIGGFIAVGVIGLFVGAILLSISYELVLAWLEVSCRSQSGKVTDSAASSDL